MIAQPLRAACSGVLLVPSIAKSGARTGLLVLRDPPRPARQPKAEVAGVKPCANAKYGKQETPNVGVVKKTQGKCRVDSSGGVGARRRGCNVRSRRWRWGTCFMLPIHLRPWYQWRSRRMIMRNIVAVESIASWKWWFDFLLLGRVWLSGVTSARGRRYQLALAHQITDPAPMTKVAQQASFWGEGWGHFQNSFVPFVCVCANPQSQRPV